MDIPGSITDFFRYKNAHDEAGLASVFAADAIVIDAGENKEMRGIDEIKTWIQKSLSGLNLHTEIGQVKRESATWVLETIVSGDFKASPAKFEYFIKVQDAKITSLRVQFRGSLSS
ncbi:MAG: nuclear transport factor 2 family protein [Candidatus Moraniibacteriota bacterium]